MLMSSLAKQQNLFFSFLLDGPQGRANGFLQDAAVCKTEGGPGGEEEKGTD